MRRAIVLATFGARWAAPISGLSRQPEMGALPGPMALRPVFSQMRLVSNSKLAAATLSEMEDEQQRSERPEKPEMPASWTLDRKIGETFFTMRRTYEDEEIVLQYTGECEKNGVATHTFIVFVVCKNKGLVFNMSVEEGEIVLNNVCFRQDAKLAMDSAAESQAKNDLLYGGPDVADLEDSLVEAFASYLEERGVNDDLGNFIERYSYWAEQAEYEEWLGNINKFVS
uniref:Putative p22 protein n=1 Tax=Trypanosoma congolense (strain IL3000) TaxID=1068625 RepID=G0UNJ8_TRYCI|nr:putative p22 protein precursor [Trypanosoma congolense IL3000]